eukprot:gnl/TRDRNA2_/TRDRNA2_72157_c0_seq1.p1 gnl/TRDRNA2_/TRDRNA2_72157_c0~~gnl/TRDRNA2_/TRDRNA2_72157_c0_seq1.p1  ORF type:complete len:317 (-),score=40.13 gnl/TRDRNA2_/TRDRNA2_72157_c0_seq1:395-1306(-)
MVGENCTVNCPAGYVVRGEFVCVPPFFRGVSVCVEASRADEWASTYEWVTIVVGEFEATVGFTASVGLAEVRAAFRSGLESMFEVPSAYVTQLSVRCKNAFCAEDRRRLLDRHLLASLLGRRLEAWSTVVVSYELTVPDFDIAMVEQRVADAMQSNSTALQGFLAALEALGIEIKNLVPSLPSVYRTFISRMLVPTSTRASTTRATTTRASTTRITRRTSTTRAAISTDRPTTTTTTTSRIVADPISAASAADAEEDGMSPVTAETAAITIVLAVVGMIVVAAIIFREFRQCQRRNVEAKANG